MINLKNTVHDWMDTVDTLVSDPCIFKVSVNLKILRVLCPTFKPNLFK